ncbi:peptidoglycan editing factor PgeF [Brevibacillus humidisoli]|uniref:peptidoglycan editing factor PgeF n=1 Tax=Brevibacillus humidisoli TaxID=2895522 RepID=UPI001E61CD52|nr:peptidoglycan editing factor PgeF [Brevibacillus humidisoli]UFJ41938.1 peptidoglycan editing factor PgeF [Brevibacillus humidisoli]
MEPFQIVAQTDTLRLNGWEQRCPGLVAGFTLRSGGLSEVPYDSLNLGLHVGDNPDHVRKNRQVVCRQVGFDFEAWTCGEQVHGTAVEQVTDAQRGSGRERADRAIPAVDGLYTDKAEILLTSYYADCIPLYVLDPQKRVIGLAHAGWKGTVGRIAAVMLRALEESYGCKPDELLVAIGPSIRGCCYEVDEKVMEHVRGSTANWKQSVQPGGDGRYMLDLAELNQQILIESGVPSSHISRSNYCTACNGKLFFSHRRDKGRTGRMASFIGWKAKGVE